MAKKTTRQQLEKVVSNVDEDKESVIVLHSDWETDHLGFCAVGTRAHLAAMVSSTLEQDPSENPVTKALLTGFAVANYVQKGKLVKTIKSISKHIEENKMDDHSVLPK